MNQNNVASIRLDGCVLANLRRLFLFRWHAFKFIRFFFLAAHTQKRRLPMIFLTFSNPFCCCCLFCAMHPDAAQKHPYSPHWHFIISFQSISGWCCCNFIYLCIFRFVLFHIGCCCNSFFIAIQYFSECCDSLLIRSFARFRFTVGYLPNVYE